MINSETMKQTVVFSKGFNWFLIFILLVLSVPAVSQETSKVSPPLPDYINKIVSVSCMPCHSSSGGYASKSKLNFNEWTDYSVDKQLKKAQLMYKKLKKNEMPPKTARENNPDIIPTSEQLAIIKSWADSLEAGNK
jgi:hypothetical protein